MKITYEEADKSLLHYGSYEKMGAILELIRSAPIDFGTWLRILGENWSDCDNISTYQNPLKCLLPKRGPVVEMMTKKELAAYEALPEIVTIYRGSGKKNKNGPSWSLDKNVASKFPFLNRYKVDDPMLLTATVDKRLILAVKLDRNESEVITFNAKPGKGMPLSPPEGFSSEVTSEVCCADTSSAGIASYCQVVSEAIFCEAATAIEMVTA